MAQAIKAIRGMNDILPEQTAYWQFVEAQCHAMAQAYAYREIRFPIVESTALFKRSIGDVTDIVEKEMYSFDDRNGDNLSLRPEGTAGCVRAGIEQGLLYNQLQRLYYMGPMFRHERPQKGRYRQFHQMGVEAFGMPGPEVEVEQILMARRLWQSLKIEDQITLQVNTLGSLESRKQYRTQLVDYFTKYKNTLDEDSQRRLHTNPLRILDSKNPAMQDLLNQAPRLMDNLDADSKAHFNRLCVLLDAVGIAYEINPRIVRGLDYYSQTVYEWVTDALGAQGTVCAGGRYDSLVQQLGGKATSAVGFAIGLERLVLLLQDTNTLQLIPDAYFVCIGDAAVQQALVIAEQCRQNCPSLKIEVNCAGGGFKSQFKRADKSAARFALIIGEEELAAGKISVKDLRGEQAQQSVLPNELTDFLIRSQA